MPSDGDETVAMKPSLFIPAFLLVLWSIDQTSVVQCEGGQSPAAWPQMSVSCLWQETSNMTTK